MLAIVAMVWFEFRRRADLKQHDMPLPSMIGTIIKLVLLGALILVFGLLLASYRGVPVVGLILLTLVIVYTFVTQRTVTGRRVYAVGGNRHAAGLSGVDTKKIDFFVMVNMGFLAAIAGMVFTAYLNAANPKDGQNFELDAIASVFIGGAAVAGGVGTVAGSMIGGLVMGVLNLGLANMSVDSNWIQIIKGLVLLGAVAFDVISKMRGKPNFIDMLIRSVGGGRGDRSGPALGLPGTGSETGETPVKVDGARADAVTGFKKINGASVGATGHKRETAGRG